nr:hypothetical protein [Tanacetum cinerariifolium]
RCPRQPPARPVAGGAAAGRGAAAAGAHPLEVSAKPHAGRVLPPRARVRLRPARARPQRSRPQYAAARHPNQPQLRQPAPPERPWGACSTCSACALPPSPTWRRATYWWALPQPLPACTAIFTTWGPILWPCSTSSTCARPSRRACGWPTAATCSKRWCSRWPSACASKSAYFVAKPFSMPTSAQAPAVPRLTYLRIKNYRALRDVEFRDLTPLTVLIGPNGSGKSTVLDALDFLAEAVRGNLVAAWEKRDRFRGMRTRGEEGNIEFEVHFFIDNQTATYSFSINGTDEIVKVNNELLTVEESGIIRRVFYVVPDNKVSNYYGIRYINDYASDTEEAYRAAVRDDFVNLVMQQTSPWRSFAAVVQGITNTITSYRLFHLTDDHLKGYSDAGPREKLSPNGDNLPNVLYYLHLKHPEVLARIADKLRAWVP